MSPGINPRNKSKGIREFFPRYSTLENVFPFPEFFEHQLKAEWTKPTANKQFPAFIFKKAV